MENREFDALARSFARPGTRRRLVRGGAAGLLALAAGLVARRPAAADHCTYAGCGCATGTYHPCSNGLICCPSAPGTPGGAGVCATAGECGTPCTSSGVGCPAYCNWGDDCPNCCSGQCGTYGTCA